MCSRSFLPSQTRYIRYFATLIRHCYSLAADEGEVEEEMHHLQRHLTEHILRIDRAHKQSLHVDDGEDQLLDKDTMDLFDAMPKKCWSFYHRHALNLLNSGIGVVIEHVAIFNFFEEIDPFMKWSADIFRWKQDRKCIEYETLRFGRDDEPGNDCAVIQRLESVQPMVLEKDFGLRVYTTKGNTDDERERHRKFVGQIIVHSHFLSLDEKQCIKFNKAEIDFVHKDKNHKHFPEDFHIVIKARILRRKS